MTLLIDIPSLLAKFPPLPSSIAISTESVAEGDVIAYKTLTLCMETWQPLLSAWLCGRVTSVTPSEGTIYVMPMALSINDQQLQWKESTQVEEEVVVVQVSELSELRYLDGPSFQAMKELQNQQQS
uniref:Coilin tudor domain-containing protein n=1 Tax=Globisporangium ultimum (strain ATCC 200006 / CBS 805.95 / DAOM BR144) TaxID=431595 RepID=K3WEJ7_GLOUD